MGKVCLVSFIHALIACSQFGGVLTAKGLPSIFKGIGKEKGAEVWKPVGRHGVKVDSKSPYSR